MPFPVTCLCANTRCFHQLLHHIWAHVFVLMACSCSSTPSSSPYRLAHRMASPAPARPDSMLPGEGEHHLKREWLTLPPSSPGEIVVAKASKAQQTLYYTEGSEYPGIRVSGTLTCTNYCFSFVMETKPRQKVC